MKTWLQSENCLHCHMCCYLSGNKWLCCFLIKQNKMVNYMWARLVVVLCWAAGLCVDSWQGQHIENQGQLGRGFSGCSRAGEWFVLTVLPVDSSWRRYYEKIKESNFSWISSISSLTPSYYPCTLSCLMTFCLKKSYGEEFFFFPPWEQSWP